MTMTSMPNSQELAGANLTGIGLAFAVVGLVILVSSLLLGRIPPGAAEPRIGR